MRTEIVYEDERLLVVYKPAGLATESARISQADVVSELKNYLSHGTKIPYLGLAHRLDQPVEGLLAVAKDSKTAAELTRQLQSGQMKKSYLAVVYLPEAINCGLNEPVELTDFLLKEGGQARIVTGPPAERESDQMVGVERNGAKRAAQPSGRSAYDAVASRGAQKAVLTYRLQKVQGQIALVRVELETGRFRQIRCQMAAHGMPLLGDLKYGNEESMALSRELQVKSVTLCADMLTFQHPETGKELKVTVKPRNEVFRLLDGEI
ncbi:MAG: pseudouridine synthase [Lachnospiraceae bacterium]|nr:pseudouridine synthase [Lachnospiraceae bacterium]